MYLRSPFPDPPPLPDVNAHYIFFKRADQAEWPNYTVHIDPTTDTRLMYHDYIRNIEDLSTGLAAPLSEGGMGLQGWEEGVGAEAVKAGEKEIVGILSENSSVSKSSAFPLFAWMLRTYWPRRMMFLKGTAQHYLPYWVYGGFVEATPSVVAFERPALGTSSSRLRP